MYDTWNYRDKKSHDGLFFSLDVLANYFGCVKNTKLIVTSIPAYQVPKVKREDSSIIR